MSYFCDYCTCVFNKPDCRGCRENCPRCGNPDFEEISEKGSVVNQTSDLVMYRKIKIKAAIYTAVLTIVWLIYEYL